MHFFEFLKRGCTKSIDEMRKEMMKPDCSLFQRNELVLKCRNSCYDIKDNNEQFLHSIKFCN